MNERGTRGEKEEEVKTKEKERQRVAGGPPVFLPHLFPLALFCLRWHHRHLYRPRHPRL